MLLGLLNVIIEKLFKIKEFLIKVFDLLVHFQLELIILLVLTIAHTSDSIKSFFEFSICHFLETFIVFQFS